MWICFALSLVLAVITVRFISNYAQKSQLQEYKSFSNISSVTKNIISVSLTGSVNTQPRSAPLRLFFFCWVCYSVAISTVFQAYLTTFLIELGYEEPIKNREQMLRSEKYFSFREGYEYLYPETLEPVDSAILKDALRCPKMIRVPYGQLYVRIFQLLWRTWKWNSFVVGDIGQMKIRGLHYVNWKMVLSELSIMLLWLGKDAKFFNS
jgi:hypothetical protein